MAAARMTLPQVLVGLLAVAFLLNLAVFHHFDAALVGDQLEPPCCREVVGKGAFVDVSLLLGEFHWSRLLPKYALHAYIPEGSTEPTPVVFMPGHGGGHEQFRHFAATLQTYGASRNLTFDIFAVDHNNEYSGLHGGSVASQAVFLVDCVNVLLDRYASGAEHVMLVAHSMGGVIARGVFLEPRYRAGSVKAIVSLGTPHGSPAVSFDWRLMQFYDRVSTLWASNATALDNVSLRYILLGANDKMISTELGFMDSPHAMHVWAGASGCYPPHNPFTTCGRVADAVASTILGHLDERGALLGKAQRLGGEEAVHTGAAVEFGEEQVRERLSPDEVAELGRVYEVSGPRQVECLVKEANCLRASRPLRFDAIYAECDRMYYTRFSVDEGQRVIVDGGACHGLIHSSANSPPETTRLALSYGAEAVRIGPTSNIRRRIVLRLGSSDFYYHVRLSRTPKAVRVRNDQTGEVLWFHNQANLLIRMNRNPFLVNDGRTDTIDVYFAEAADFGKPLKLTVETAWWPSLGNWLKRYGVWLASVLYVASLQGAVGSGRVGFWKPSVFVTFALLLVGKYLLPALLPSLSQSVFVSGALLSWIDSGPFTTLLVFASFWMGMVGALIILTWLFAGPLRFSLHRPCLRRIVQAVTYACAVLTPVPWSLTASLLGLSLMLFVSPATTPTQRGFLMLLGTTWLISAPLLGVWPRNLQQGDFSMLDHALWVTLPIAVTADLLGADAVDRGAPLPRPVVWLVSVLVLAYGLRLAFILNYVTALVALSILAGRYARPQPIK